MSIDARLNKLVPALTARERAVLLLRSLHEKTPEDPAWRSTMPPSQARELNRYIGLINACNLQVPYMITVIEKDMEKLELMASWWFTLLLWQTNLAEIDYAASVVARESITESEYRRIAAAQANAYVSVATLAYELAEYRRDWTNSDVRPVGGWSDEVVVKDDVWTRLKREAEAELRKAVEEGKLDARGRGKRLSIRSGSFDAWVGRRPRVFHEWAGGYDVLPDDREAQVEADRRTLANLRDAIRRTPLQRMGDDGEGASLAAMMDGLIQRMMSLMALRWLDILQVETVIAEVAEDFGEDPLKPGTRAALDTAKATLLNIQCQLKAHNKVLVLSEPNEQDLDEMRSMLVHWSQ